MIIISDIEHELASQLEEVFISNSTDKEFFGQRHNEYNPQIHLDCFFAGAQTMEELILRLDLLKDLVEDLKEEGWELSIPIEENVMVTDYRGEGRPDPGYSMFDDEGYDIAGNHIDDFDEFEGE